MRGPLRLPRSRFRDVPRPAVSERDHRAGAERAISGCRCDFSGAADREGKHDRLDGYGVSPRFLRAATGVNVSPTKNMRKLESSFSVENGDAALIGGLTPDKTTRIDSGLSSFLPS